MAFSILKINRNLINIFLGSAQGVKNFSNFNISFNSGFNSGFTNGFNSGFNNGVVFNNFPCSPNLIAKERKVVYIFNILKSRKKEKKYLRKKYNKVISRVHNMDCLLKKIKA